MNVLGEHCSCWCEHHCVYVRSLVGFSATRILIESILFTKKNWLVVRNSCVCVVHKQVPRNRIVVKECLAHLKLGSAKLAAAGIVGS